VSPAVTATFSTINPGILIAAYNFGIQGNNPMQSKSGSIVNLTILHHSDFHSELLPCPLADYKTGTGNDDTVGGIARIATLINQIKTGKGAMNESVLTFMAGDFLMGTPFSWLGTFPGGSSPELVLMKMLGYDAIAIGNHEFDYSPHGLSLILKNTNSTLNGNMPLILCSNLDMTFDPYGLSKFIQNNKTINVITNGQTVKIGLFSVVGYGANATMFFQAPYKILDPIQTAAAQVAYFKNQGVDLIIMLSHNGYKEDMYFVSKVDGIDLIISGHDHALLTQPIVLSTPSGNTTIVDAKAHGEYLGKLELSVALGGNAGQGIGIRSYNAISIDDSIAESPGILDPYTAALNMILAGIGLPPYNTIIAHSSFNVPSSSGESAIGDLLADSIRWQIEVATGELDFAFIPDGVIRHGFYSENGYITLYDAISVVPFGGVPYQGPYLGWLECKFYLYGYEVKRALEMSVTLRGDFFLQVSGLRFWYDDAAPPTMKVVYVEQLTKDGYWISLDDNKLYSVGVNLEGALLIPQIGQMYPMFELIPKNSTGYPLPIDPAQYIPKVLVFDPSTKQPIPEWLSLVNYLVYDQEGEVDDIYSAPQHRINMVTPMAEGKLWLRVDSCWKLFDDAIIYKTLDDIDSDGQIIIKANEFSAMWNIVKHWQCWKLEFYICRGELGPLKINIIHLECNPVTAHSPGILFMGKLV